MTSDLLRGRSEGNSVCMVTKMEVSSYVLWKLFWNSQKVLYTNCFVFWKTNVWYSVLLVQTLRFHSEQKIAKLLCNTEPFPLKRSIGIKGLNYSQIFAYHSLSGAKVCKSCRWDIEKCWKMSIWLQKSVSIQRRTSLSKFAKFRPKVRTKVRTNIGI